MAANTESFYLWQALGTKMQKNADWSKIIDCSFVEWINNAAQAIQMCPLVTMPGTNQLTFGNQDPVHQSRT
jgi:hypothetical protein